MLRIIEIHKSYRLEDADGKGAIFAEGIPQQVFQLVKGFYAMIYAIPDLSTRRSPSKTGGHAGFYRHPAGV